MKKLIIVLLLQAIAFHSNAQAQQRDTVVLSVYNNNQRFMLYPMPFGKDKPDIDFTATMLVSLDTIHVLKTDTEQDSTGNYPTRQVVERACGKIPTDSLSGKVALIYMNTGCDISTQVLKAQQAGAIVAILIHTTDSRDSVVLPKQSNLFPYLDSSAVKIPCFTVRKSIGAKLATMLPSLVGIQRPIQDIDDIQLSKRPNPPIQQDKIGIKQNIDSLQNLIEQNTLDKQNPNNPTHLGWVISPNPATDEVVIQYNFEVQEDINPLNIEIFNEIGQIITSYHLPNPQTGRLRIDVSAWQNGAYHVRLHGGHFKDVKRVVVMH